MAAAKKSTKKSAAKKSTAKKSTKKSAAKKSAAKKSTARKSTKKAPAKKAPAKKATRKSTARAATASSGAQLVVASRLKEAAKAQDVRVAGDFTEAFNAEVNDMLSRAIARTRSNGRGTVRPGDL